MNFECRGTPREVGVPELTKKQQEVASQSAKTYRFGH